MRKILSLIALLTYTVIATAQVPVRDEPRHHNVFENEYVRLLDVHLGPGDTTLYHLHKTPSVFIILSNSNVGSRLMGGQPQKGANVNGEVSYDSLSSPRIHQVWSEDTSWFHVMDIELTAKGQTGKISILNDPALHLLFNKQQVNGYAIDLNPTTNLKLPASANGYLLVSRSRCTIEFKINNGIEHRVMKEGHYIWIEKNKVSSLQTMNKTSFVLLQLK